MGAMEKLLDTATWLRLRAWLTSGTSGWPLSTWAPPSSTTENEPTNPKALPTRSWYWARFWLLSNWSSRASSCSLRPQTPPSEFWYAKNAWVPTTAPLNRPGTGPVRSETLPRVMLLPVTPTSVLPLSAQDDPPPAAWPPPPPAPLACDPPPAAPVAAPPPEDAPPGPVSVDCWSAGPMSCP